MRSKTFWIYKAIFKRWNFYGECLVEGHVTIPHSDVEQEKFLNWKFSHSGFDLIIKKYMLRILHLCNWSRSKELAFLLQYRFIANELATSQIYRGRRTDLFWRVRLSEMIKQGAQIYPDLHHFMLDCQCRSKYTPTISHPGHINSMWTEDWLLKHTPPGLRQRAITSRYSTILWAVSMKKQVATASHAPAVSFSEPYIYQTIWHINS